MAVATKAPVVLVTPSVHYAVLSEVPPEADARTAQNVAKLLAKAWQNGGERLGNLQRVVASELGSGVNASDLEVTVSTDYHGITTPVVYKHRMTETVIYPELTVKLPNGIPIKTQVTTNIPSYRKGKGRVSLNWASVNAYYDPTQHPSAEQRETTVKPDDLQQTLGLYMRIATVLSQHEFETMKSQGEAPQPYKSAKQTMITMVTTLGVQDERLKELFELLEESSKGLRELLPRSGPGVDELLSTYFRAAGFDGNLANVKPWGSVFSANVSVYGERFIETKQVLYVLGADKRKKEVKAFAVGYSPGFDTSMAAQASSKIADHIRSLLF